MVKILIGFFVGAVIVAFWPYHEPTTNQMRFECPKINIPSCPAVPECNPNPDTLNSLKLHQELLMECYSKFQKCQDELGNCRDSEVNLKGEIEDWRNRYYNNNSTRCDDN